MLGVPGEGGAPPLNTGGGGEASKPGKGEIPCLLAVDLGLNVRVR